MRVFDCFTFYNEFDLLEIRIQELWDSVDYFVIAEANTTHQNNPKSFYLKDNWARYEKYASKIRHVMIDDMPQSPNTWVNENFQRKAIERGLTDLQPDDIVIVSDCDEIARPEVIDAIKEDTTVNNYERYQLFIPLHCFKVNLMMVQPHHQHGNIMVTRGRAFTDPHNERTLTFPWTPNAPDLVQIKHAGWHFSYLGDTEFAKNKLKNFAHAESNTPELLNSVNVDEMIKTKLFMGGERGTERFEYVLLDDYYPKTILNNQEKYKDLIIPDATIQAYDLFPAE